MKKNLFKFLILISILFLAVPAFAQTRIVDNAGLLSADEKNNLTALVDSISVKYNFDLIIVTEKNISDSNPSAYANNFFDENSYGQGQDKSGCLFLHVIGSRDYWFSTSGRGIKILNDTAGNKLEADAIKYLRDGSNYEAYKSFIVNWEKFLALDAKGKHYNFIHQWNAVLMVIAWIAAFLIGIIVIMVWKKGMNAVIAQTQADAYTVPGSLAFKVKKDTFLYSRVTKTERQTDNNSGSRGSFRSSSGSHGGRGGRY